MKLNHDCIRDILLFIESQTTDELSSIDSDTLIHEFESKYTKEIIYYHVRKIHLAGLLEDVFYAENSPYLIGDLSWEGHSYVDNIRDNKVWAKLKSISRNLSSVSLPFLVEKAPDIVKLFMSNF